MSDVSERSDDAMVMTRSEEELALAKRWRPTEVVRVSKRIVTEERTITVAVRREELVVERHPYVGGADSAGPELRTQDTYVLTLSEEEPVIDMRMVPRDRVRVIVETVTEQRVVTEQLRKEEVDVVEDPV